MYMGQVATPTYGAASPPQAPATGTGSIFGQLVGAGLGIWGAISQQKAQQKLADTNLELAKQAAQGGYAYNPVEYGQVPGLIPTARVQAGLDPGLSNMLMIGGAGLLGIMVLSMVMKR